MLVYVYHFDFFSFCSWACFQFRVTGVCPATMDLVLQVNVRTTTITTTTIPQRRHRGHSGDKRWDLPELVETTGYRNVLCERPWPCDPPPSAKKNDDTKQN